MNIKGKHLGLTILLILDIMGIWWINTEFTFLGLLSAMSILVTIIAGSHYLVSNWNDNIF